MRVVALLIFFAACFGIAATWQSHRLRELERARAIELEVRDGRIGRTQSGLVERGFAEIVVGAPSGVEPPPRPAPSAGSAALDPPPAEPLDHAPLLADFELTVQSGQTLSEIAREHYGTAAAELVSALATYNGLDDADELTVGQVLSLPPVDRLPR